MLTRRDMLKRSALVSCAPLVPTFLTRAASAAHVEADRRILVVIQLDGGNDGLNTVVPYRDVNYARLRPKLQIKPDRIIKVNDEIGLHPAMKAAGELLDSGRLAIVQGVGYPNPNRSHFRSMSIWQTARLDEADHGQYGWLGRTLDSRGAGQTGPQGVFVGSGSTPLTLWSRRSTVAALQSGDDLALQASGELLQSALKSADSATELERFVAQSSENAFATAQRLSTLVDLPRGVVGNGNSQSRLAEQLQLISALIKSDCHARVFYTVQSGYDTHAAQLPEHFDLLRGLSTALKTFLDDLAASGLADRVLVLAFSEFGRRAAENDSEGTDHGAAAPVFLAGPTLAKSIIGPQPNLTDLQDGDVKMAIDFRQVYATILDQWLDVRAHDVLAGEFEPLPLFKKPKS